MSKLSLLQCEDVTNFRFPCKSHASEQTHITSAYFSCIFVTLRFHYRTRDSAQNGVQIEKFKTIFRQVRGNASFKPLSQDMCFPGMHVSRSHINKAITDYKSQ